MTKDEAITPEDFLTQIETFHQNPSLEEYVRLRKAQPGMGFEYITSDGIEFLFSESDMLTQNGIDLNLFSGALEGYRYEQSRLSINLLEKLMRRDSLAKAGETQLVSRKKEISNSLVNYLIANMLDSCNANGELGISWDLLVLIKYQLGVLKSEFELKNKKNDERKQAMLIAVTMAAQGKKPTYRAIARKMSVEASTVMRWFPDNSMLSDAQKLFGELKNLRAIEKATSVAHKS